MNSISLEFIETRKTFLIYIKEYLLELMNNEMFLDRVKEYYFTYSCDELVNMATDIMFRMENNLVLSKYCNSMEYELIAIFVVLGKYINNNSNKVYHL